jgi:hypothetical protein
MTRFGASARRIIMWTSVVLAVLASSSTSALAAYEITGYVQNRTTNHASEGDEVMLLRLDQGLQEEARTVTNAHGAFVFNVQFPDKLYLVRVIHQGVDYDQQVLLGSTVFVDVFNAAPKVQGVTGTIEIIRTGTNGNFLHVSDLYELRNDSHPPLTQAGKRTFDVYLPPDANIDSVLAAGPARIAANISAAAVPGEPGHFTVSFPLRPGATKLAFNYNLPYNGRAAFQPRLAYPLQQLAVLTPRSMGFASSSPLFQNLAAGDPRYQVHATNHLKAREDLGFEVSGIGPIPPIGGPTKSTARQQLPVLHEAARVASTQATSPHLARGGSGLEQARPSAHTLVLLGLTATFLGACALLIWSRRGM